MDIEPLEKAKELITKYLLLKDEESAYFSIAVNVAKAAALISVEELKKQAEEFDRVINNEFSNGGSTYEDYWDDVEKELLNLK